MYIVTDTPNSAMDYVYCSDLCSFSLFSPVAVLYRCELHSSTNNNATRNMDKIHTIRIC